MSRFKTNLVLVNSPLDVRKGIQHYIGLDQPREIREDVKAAVIYKALQKSISTALGFYNDDSYDYSKQAVEAVAHVRRLVLGWLILPGESVFGPLSSVDDRVTPQAVNGLSRWISEQRGQTYQRRTAFFEELIQVIYCAQADYKTTQRALIGNDEILFSDLLLKWADKTDLFQADDTDLRYFWLKDFRENYVEARGPELIAQHAQIYANHILSGAVKDDRDFIPTNTGVLEPDLTPNNEILEPDLEPQNTSDWDLSDYFD